jgi:hypothetical protein
LLQDEFFVDNLHEPLQDLLSPDYSADLWAQQHAKLLALEDKEVGRFYEPPMWHLPEKTMTTLYECVFVKLWKTALWDVCVSQEIESYKMDLIKHMQADPELEDIMDAKYFRNLMNKKICPDAKELYAVCDLEQVDVKVFDNIVKTEFTYRYTGVPKDVIHLVKMDIYFLVRMQDNAE